MKFRKLRIAWSVAWAIIFLLLVACWMRSYFMSDTVTWQLTTEQSLRLDSENGVPTIVYFDDAVRGFIPIPVWSALLVAAILTAIPWIRARFSLRTLLITTMLIAVLLGLVVLLK